MAQQRKTYLIPRATAARILMKAGAKRVSAPAAGEFADVIQEIAEGIGVRSVKMARHAGRKTVHEEDIKIAAK